MRNPSEPQPAVFAQGEGAGCQNASPHTQHVLALAALKKKKQDIKYLSAPYQCLKWHTGRTRLLVEHEPLLKEEVAHVVPDL
jgi:hypothetical protein